MPDLDLSDDPQVHVGDTGTVLLVTVVDQDGAPVDISAATTLRIYLTRPDRTTVTKTAVRDTTGTDGKMRYTTQAGDLNQDGTWKIQGYVAGASGWSGSTREVAFQVFKSRIGV